MMLLARIKLFTVLLVTIGLVCSVAGCSSNATTSDQKTKPLVNNVKIDGLFGAKWLMSKNEVLQKVGECKQANADSYMQIREYLGRKATVNYNFNNEKLWMVLITFMESYDSGKANMTETIKRFDATQTLLEKQYGEFSLKKNDNENKTREFSFVASDNIKVTHSINKKEPYILEQVMFFIWNGK